MPQAPRNLVNEREKSAPNELYSTKAWYTSTYNTKVFCFKTR